MIKYLIFYLLTIPSANCFFGKPNFLPKINTDKIDISKKLDIQNHFFPFNDNDMSADQLSNIDTHNCLINNFDFDHLKAIIEMKEKEIGKHIVIKISSFLPHFDGIGHKVLHANNEFISYILSLENMTDGLKKEIILFSIRLAQMGDDFGSKLLQMYYDIVDKSL